MKSIFANNSAMNYYPPSLLYQRGISLMELMVGIVLGLLVVAVAMGALMVSRQVGGTVSDASDIQQQAAYAMRVIGQQVRQAGVMRLALYRDALGMEEECDNDIVCPVSLVDENIRRDNEQWSLAPVLSDVNDEGPRMVFINVKDIDGSELEKNMWSANCLGDIANGAVYSHFKFENSTLACASSSSGSAESNDYQPVLRNVADFQTRYIAYDSAIGQGQQKIKYMEADDVRNMDNGWDKIQGMEICLTLFGKERISMPADATYQGCAGPEQYSAITDDKRRDRLHLTFRSVFQLRGQGRPTQPPLPTL